MYLISWSEEESKLEASLGGRVTIEEMHVVFSEIEELMDELTDDYTIAIVTHNMQQAARVSAYTAFMYLGEMIEFGTTSKMFTTPTDRRTQDYITGRFG